MKIYIVLTFLTLIAYNTIAQQPIISNISKTRAAGGQKIELSGSGFSSNVADLIVRFGAMEGIILNSTDNFIEVQVPTGSTLSSISVTNKSNGLTGYSSAQFLPIFPGETDATLSFTQKTTVPNAIELFDIAIADFDNDGLNDLVATKRDGTATDIVIYRNTTVSNTISFAEQTKSIGNPTVNIATGDVDGDGKIDLVISRGGNTNRNEIYVLRNTSSLGNVSFADAKSYFIANGYFAKTVVIRDLDLDGKPEVVVTNTFNNQLSIFENNSTSGTINLSFTPTLLAIEGASTTNGLAIDDLNNDGKPDLVITQFSADNIYIVPNESVDGNLIFGTQQELLISSNLNNVAIADLNLDGIKDIVATRTIDGKITVLEGTGNDYGFSSPTTFNTGAISWGISIGDFSGNGKPDVVITASSSSTFSFLKNTSDGGVLTLTPMDIAQTLNSRNTIIGDLNGDTKPDIGFTSFSGSVSELLVIRNTTCVQPVLLEEDEIAEICPTQTYRFNVIPAEGTTFVWKKSGVEVKSSTDPFYDSDVSLTAGTYTYTVTAQGESLTCSIESASFTLTVSASGSSIPNDPVASNSGLACVGTSTQLFATTVTGATYNWTGPNGFSSPEQNPTIDNITAEKSGIYYVFAEISPCKSAVSSTIVEVIIPPDFTIVPSGATIFCEGNSISLWVASEVGYSYQWQKDGNDISGETTNTLSVTTAGEYQALVANIDCDLTSNLLEVSTLPIPSPSFTTGSVLCIDTEVNFTNTTTIETGQTPIYSWDFGDGGISADENPVHTFVEAKDHTVTLTVEYAGQSCIGGPIPQTVTISSPNVLSIAPTVAGSIPFCQGESATIEASGDFTAYLWETTNETTSSIEVNTPGYFVAIATSAAGCLTKDSIEVIIDPLPLITATAEPDTIQSGLTSQLLATGALDYQWTPVEGLDDPISDSPIATLTASATYMVSGVDLNGCPGEAEVSIVVLDSGEDLPVTADTAFSPNGDGNYDEFIITGIENFPDCELVIFDRSGRIVLKETGYNNDWDGIDEQGNPVPVGAYFYTLSCNDGKAGSGSISVIR